ncbi:helix-turn-helix domain-containing protein [Breznakibacter xylanolyticus]|nr:helix-turn-helix domain-containing protein [Breznakibacter xylanolyticus]
MSTTIETERICEYCGGNFVAKTTVTRYCSHKCSSRAYKQRVRNNKIEKSCQETRQTIQKPIEELKAKDFLNMLEVQTLIGVSKRTLYRMIERKELIIGKFGRRTVVRRSDIETIFGKPYNKPTQKAKTPITEFYTLKEAQDKHNIKYDYLNNIIQKHKIPKTTFNGKTYISKVHIDKYFKKIEEETEHITNWYSIQEIQEKYNLSRDQIYLRVHDHHVPKQKNGRFIKISKIHFDEIMTISI